MKLVVLVEEASTKEVLDVLLPTILPAAVSFQVVPFNGRGDLESNIARKLSGWNEPNVRFVILEDQDSADCKKRKQHLVELVAKSGKTALIRIACRELEAWYLGDLEAVANAYDKPELTRLLNKRKYRDTDCIVDVKEEFQKLVPEHQQITGAKKIAPFLEVERNRSPSFQFFVSGIQRVVGEQAIGPDWE